MNEQQFLATIQTKAVELGINPLLMLSGIEGLYTFRDMQLNEANYQFLDSLILTIFALRIGDQFHSLAQENLESSNMAVSLAAEREMTELTPEQIAASANPYLQSFANLLNGKSVVRRYHEKALEVAALEIRKAQLQFGSDSIAMIMLNICKTELQDILNLDALFNS